MARLSGHLENLNQLFLKSVKSVQPASLFCVHPFIIDLKKSLAVAASNENDAKTSNESTSASQSSSSHSTPHNFHIVGFGKAVLGMAVQLERILANRLKSGIISIPCGTLDRFANTPDMILSQNTVLKIFECAENNLPDDKAVMAAKLIQNLAQSMTCNDILFVLISGGGSALLPLPKPTITLETKLNLIQKLVSCGANINEINTVRIAISAIKGGKLAQSARNAKEIISLIISDVIDDPLDIIASGPTFPFQVDNKNRKSAQEILSQFNLWNTLNHEIQLVITDQSAEQHIELKNNYTRIIGNNQIATKVCAEEAQQLGYLPFILSTRIQGNIADLSSNYEKFLQNLRAFRQGNLQENQFYQEFPFDKIIFENFITTIKKVNANQPLLLILGGETTVLLSGNGTGGRNQELALRMSIKINENPSLNEICFLSAGTDGIDGPTIAAGAFGCHKVVQDYLKDNSKTDLLKFIDENNSYEFYKNLENGKYHLITGHTGTNVMDLHLILIPSI